MSDSAGFVLAGGRSTRMGEDKAFLQFEGAALLQRALRVLGEVTPRVVIVGPRDRFEAFGETIQDVYPGRGPLAGIHAALSAGAAACNLVLAVDLPFVTPPLLSFLLERARESGATVTVPRAAGGFQPLCAVYRPEFCPLAAAALQQGRNKIDALFASVPVRVVEEDELARFAFSAAMFDNLNTPGDLARARRSL